MADNSDLVENRAVKEFCQRHNLASAPPFQPDGQVIALVADGLETFSDALGQATSDKAIAVEEPAWALVRAMILRGFAHVDAGVICLATGSVATAEIVSRAILECAINVLFTLQQDRAGRLYDYLAAHVSQERAELGRWESMIGGLPPEEAAAHRTEIDRKREAVDHQDVIAQEFASGAGITRPAQPWPKIGERFRAVGCELDHRVLYAAMCSQAHNDAEDLFNIFVVGAVSHLNPGQVAREFEKRQAAENAFFARLLLYRSLEYLFKCIERYGDSYGVASIARIGSECGSRMSDLTADLYQNEQRERERFRARMGPSAPAE